MFSRKKVGRKQVHGVPYPPVPSPVSSYVQVFWESLEVLNSLNSWFLESLYWKDTPAEVTAFNIAKTGTVMTFPWLYYSNTSIVSGRGSWVLKGPNKLQVCLSTQYHFDICRDCFCISYSYILQYFCMLHRSPRAKQELPAGTSQVFECFFVTKPEMRSNQITIEKLEPVKTFRIWVKWCQNISLHLLPLYSLQLPGATSTSFLPSPSCPNVTRCPMQLLPFRFCSTSSYKSIKYKFSSKGRWHLTSSQGPNPMKSARLHNWVTWKVRNKV